MGNDPKKVTALPLAALPYGTPDDVDLILPVRFVAQ